MKKDKVKKSKLVKLNEKNVETFTKLLHDNNTPGFVLSIIVDGTQNSIVLTVSEMDIRNVSILIATNIKTTSLFKSKLTIALMAKYPSELEETMNELNDYALNSLSLLKNGNPESILFKNGSLEEKDLDKFNGILKISDEKLDSTEYISLGAAIGKDTTNFVAYLNFKDDLIVRALVELFENKKARPIVAGILLSKTRELG